jgi:hypothetical protein
MKKQINVNEIMDSFFEIAIEKSVENTGQENHSYALGWVETDLKYMMEALVLTPKQKKILQARLEKKNEKRTKTVRNLMTGKDVEIPYNTPLCCDPSSETYWSM